MWLLLNQSLHARPGRCSARSSALAGRLGAGAAAPGPQPHPPAWRRSCGWPVRSRSSRPLQHRASPGSSCVPAAGPALGLRPHPARTAGPARRWRCWPASSPPRPAPPGSNIDAGGRLAAAPRARPDRRGRLDRHHQGPLRAAADGDLPMSEAVLHWAARWPRSSCSASPWPARLRMVRGPRAQDRVLGLDALYVNAMLLLLTFGIRTGTTSISRRRWSSRCSASSHRGAGEIPDARRGDRMSHAADLPVWAAVPAALLLLLGAGAGADRRARAAAPEELLRARARADLGTTSGIGCVLLASMLFFSVLQAPAGAARGADRPLRRASPRR